MRTLILLLVLLPLAACDSDAVAPANAQSVELLTGERTYHRPTAYIDVALANVSERTVYIASPSFDTVLDKRVGDAWEEVGAWYVIGGIGPFPTALEPGTYRTWPTLTIAGPTFSLEVGEYRIRTRVYEDERLERLLPEEALVSPVFEIVEE